MKKSLWPIPLFLNIVILVVFLTIGNGDVSAAPKTIQTPLTSPPAAATQLVPAVNPQGNLADLIKAANREDKGKVDVPFFDRFLPEKLIQFKILHISLWRWLSLIVILPILIIAAWLISLLLFIAIRPLIKRISGRDTNGHIGRMKNPFGLFIIAIAIFSYAPFSQSTFISLFCNQLAGAIAVVSLSWLGMRLIDVFTDHFVKNYQMTTSSGRIGITRLIGQFTKGLVFAIGLAIILYGAGINLTAVITGLGVGGIAIAFAAQKTLENLFGGIMIASDQPIRVGDLCKAGEHSGVVEGIGLRSTRIRTIDRTLISVPNGQLSIMSLENFAMRDKIRLNHTIGLRYETAADQLRTVLSDGRKMLGARSDIEQSTARIRLIGARNSAIEIEVFAYVLVTSWDAFLAIQEEILLSLLDIVQASGTSLAYQGMSLPSEEGKGETASRPRKPGKEVVRKRQTQGELI